MLSRALSSNSRSFSCFIYLFLYFCILFFFLLDVALGFEMLEAGQQEPHPSAMSPPGQTGEAQEVGGWFPPAHLVLLFWASGTRCCANKHISPTWQARSSPKGLDPNGVLVASPGSGAAAGLHTASNKSQQPFAAISKKLSFGMRLKNCYSSLHPLCTFILQKFI